MSEKTSVRSPLQGKCAKVPVVMQLEALECGAASLTMILAYYGKWIPLEQVRIDCGVSRDGSNARNILRAARSYGLDTKAYRMEPQALKEAATFPCIIHWNFNHFVVLDGFKNNMAVINDPAQGTVKVDMETFDESFTGICLMFEPGENFTPSGKQKNMLDFAKKRLEGTGTAFAFVILTSIIASIFGIIMPGFSRIFMDRLLTGVNPDWSIPFLIGLGLFSVVQLIVILIQTVYSLKIDGKMAVVGNTSYMWKVLRLPMEFFSQRYAGDIQQRQQTNASISNTLVMTTAPLFLNGIMAVFYLIVMIRYSLILSLVGLSSILVNALTARYISGKRVNLTRIMQRDQGKLASAAVSGIQMVETIKANGAEDGYFERWAGLQASVNKAQVAFDRMDQYIGMIPEAVSAVMNIVIMIIGVYLTMDGQFSVGMILAFQGFLSSFLAPISSFISAGQTIQEMRTDMERVEDVMEYPDDPSFHDEQLDEETDYGKLSGAVEMKNVTFGYSRLAPPLIESFNLSLRPGSRVAFVGSSGCGKSTLSKLISGLYQPWSGEILFDGKTRDQIDRCVLTGSLAVVDQDIILFEDTIANNIKMWDNSIEDFEMILAARDAQIHEDIMARENGYNHKLIEGGKDFSGGQRQRLEIARVLAQDPTIIIMDEATSALDARTEYEVVKAIKDRGITCIVVAHRLSTIRDCDEIIVMDQGKVVQRGTHEELIAQDGLYQQLVTNE